MNVIDWKTARERRARNSGDAGSRPHGRRPAEIIVLPILSVERMCRIFRLDPARFEPAERNDGGASNPAA